VGRHDDNGFDGMVNADIKQIYDNWRLWHRKFVAKGPPRHSRPSGGVNRCACDDRAAVCKGLFKHILTGKGY
jgi:hypothetical protein